MTTGTRQEDFNAWRRSVETLEDARKPVPGWMQTASCGQLCPARPEASKICLDDIAQSLSKICRFNGHCRGFYSVAQHSVLVSYLCPTKPMAGLLHDAAEAYVGDVVAPLKPLLIGFDAIECAVAECIAGVFGVIAADFHCPEVKRADMVALATEKRDLMGPEPWPWHPLPEPTGLHINPLLPAEAYALFKARYWELTSGRAIKKGSGHVYGD